MDKLTKKQRGFVKDYIDTGNGTQAALKNYNIEGKNPEGIASVIAVENLAKPSIKEAIQSLAERIDDDKLYKVLDEGLEAGKTVFKNNNSTGEIEEVGYEADYAVRHKYLDTALKIKGAYAPDKSINLNIEAEITNPKARELAEKYEEELKKNL